MSAKKKNYRLGLFIGLFILSLFLIFFVGTRIDKETGKTHNILTSNGLLHFKKGLDIAGGVRLTYKIDFSKYEDAYTNETELLQMKKTAQDIILKNIDNRISKLGVSDYSAYVQKLTDGEYLIVEIGGLSDIDEAKNIIGRTVELEFKLANDDNTGSDELFAQRMDMAENILSQTVNNPDQFEAIGSGKISDDIFYSHYTDATLEQLPDIYRINPNLLSSLTTGEVYPRFFSDTYHTIQQDDGNGGVTAQELNGFTIVKYNGARAVKLDTIDPARVTSIADRRGLTNEVIRRKDVEPVANGSLTHNGNTVTYIGEEALPGIEGADIALYQIVDGANAQSISDLVNSGGTPASGDAISIVDGWVDMNVLNSQFIGFDAEAEIKTYEQQEGTFVLKIRDKKTTSETLVPTIVINNLNATEGQNFINAVVNAQIYDVEDIRVQDTQTWIVAQDPKSNDILNGAFFKFANVTQSQTGKPVVSINFDDKGQTIFCNITEANIGKMMAIFVGGQLMTSPVIQDKICGGSAQIDGTFDIKGAKDLTENLNSGALPAPLLLSHEETVSPTLGASALSGAFIAAAVGFAIIYLLMMWMYGFKKASIVIITLVVFVAFLMAIFKLFGVVSSLSAIAAAILTVGMAVDANILIFERLKEEREQGKPMRQAIMDAYDRSWFPIRDGNISTGLIGFLLFTMGVNVFKGFGTTILINMFLILLVNVPLTKELLLLFYRDEK